MEHKDYDAAIHSFESARAEMRNHTSQPLLAVSLVSFPVEITRCIEIAYHLGQIFGWNFDDLGITIQQRHCESAYATGRKIDTVNSLQQMVNTFGKEIYTRGPITAWISGELLLSVLSPNTFICSLFRLHKSMSPNGVRRRGDFNDLVYWWVVRP